MKEKKMDKNRKIAILVGIFYIVGTVAGVLSMLVTQPILGTPDFLAQIAAHQGRLVSGALLVLLMGFPLSMVAVLLYPILKRHDEILALGYLVFRGALEMAAYLALATCWLFLLLVSREYAAAGTAGLPAMQSLGTVFLKGNDSIANVLVIIFSLDALMLYAMFYRSRLIPRWISVWGLIAILMHFSTAFLQMYEVIDINTASLINLPIFVQEMVMAVWLIAKGFNPSALVPASK
jgi:hypothetical protein